VLALAAVVGALGLAPRPVIAEEPATKRVRFHLDLVHADGRVEEVSISEVYVRGERWPIGDGQPAIAPVAGGYGVSLTTRHPGPAFRSLYVKLPAPSPEVLRVRSPVWDHPRLRQLAFRAVDEEGKPIAGATHEFVPGFDLPPFIVGDREGIWRIDVPPRRESFCAVAQGARHCHHAAGHLVLGGGWRGSPTEERCETGDADRLSQWLEWRPVDVVLPRLPAGRVDAPRTLRLLDARGEPVSGAYVALVSPFTPRAWRAVWHLGAALETSQWIEFNQGFRRTRPDGSFPMGVRGRVGVELRVGDDVPFASWVVPAPTSAKEPRVLRVPDRCDVRVRIDGIPPGAEVTWRRAGTASRRRLLLALAADDPTLAAADAPGPAPSAFPALFGDVEGVLRADATISLPMAVDVAAHFHLRRGDEVRALDLTPTTAGRSEVVRAWKDLRVPTKEELREDPFGD
jgi:hypothetical protein